MVIRVEALTDPPRRRVVHIQADFPADEKLSALAEVGHRDRSVAPMAIETILIRIFKDGALV